MSTPARVTFEVDSKQSLDVAATPVEPEYCPALEDAEVVQGSGRSARRRRAKRGKGGEPKERSEAVAAPPQAADSSPGTTGAPVAGATNNPRPGTGVGKQKKVPATVKANSGGQNGDTKSREDKERLFAYDVRVVGGRDLIAVLPAKLADNANIGYKPGSVDDMVMRVRGEVPVPEKRKGDRAAWFSDPGVPGVEVKGFTHLVKSGEVQRVSESPRHEAKLLALSKSGVALQTGLSQTLLHVLGAEPTGVSIRSPFLPTAARDAGRMLEEAFPGINIALGRVPSTMFVALAHGALKLFRATNAVHVCYRTCPSWAEGTHLALGTVESNLEPTWGKNVTIGKAPVVLDEVRAAGGPKTMCRHNPLTCDCVNRDPSKLTLLFGMSQTVAPTPRDVLKWCKRFGRVVTIVPNPAYSKWNSRMTAAFRTYVTPGDVQPVVLPSNMWYGYDTRASVFDWWRFKSEVLVWDRKPLGNAFTLVEFSVKARDRAPIGVGTVMLPWQSVEFALGEEMYYALDGRAVARVDKVEKVATYLSGRHLTTDTWQGLERTAAREVLADPGALLVHEEVRATSELAWQLVRQERIGWSIFGLFRDFATCSVDWFLHGQSTVLPVLKTVASLAVGFGGAALALYSKYKIATGTVPVPVPQLPAERALRESVGTVNKGDLAFAAYSCFVAPIWEEWVKQRFGFWGVTALAAYEVVFVALRTKGDPAAVVTQVRTACAHYAWWSLGYKLGVLAHMVNNVAAYAEAYIDGRFNIHHPDLSTWPDGFLANNIAAGWMDAEGHLTPDGARIYGYGGGFVPGAGSVNLGGWLENFSAVATAVKVIKGDWDHPAGDPVEMLSVCCHDYVPGGVTADSIPTTMSLIPDRANNVSLVVVDEGRCRARANTVVLVGPGVRNAGPLVFRSCWHNEAQALRIRLGADLLWFDPNVTANWATLHSALRHEADLRTQYWQRMLDEVKPGVVQATPFEEWNSTYPAGARELNRQARADARRTGVQGVERQVSAFVKVERLPLLNAKADVKSLKPRLIQGRQPSVTATSGPTFHALGKILRRVWPLDGDQKIAYASGCTAEELGAWYTNKVRLGLLPAPVDAVVWDASVGPGPHASHRADLLALGVNDATRKVLEERATGRRGRTKFGLRYTLFYQMCSGDGDTSLMNTATNGKIWLWILRHVSVYVAANGDNALLMAPAQLMPELPGLVAKTREFGFTFEFESAERTVYDGEICSGRLWAVGDRFIYGPKIGRVLAKTFWCLDPPARLRSRVAWLRGVALGMRRDTAFIPILRTVMSCILKATVSVHAVSVEKDEPWRIHSADEHEATDETFSQMCHLYSTTREEILDAERYVLERPGGPFRTVYDHPLILRIVEVDLE